MVCLYTKCFTCVLHTKADFYRDCMKYFTWEHTITPRYSGQQTANNTLFIHSMFSKTGKETPLTIHLLTPRPRK